MTLQIIPEISSLRARLAGENSIALVPTMGNLHAGHIHLVELARQRAGCVVTSIFVNPLQFGANEDLDNYPRTLAEDCAKLQAAGADIVFTPSVQEMYPTTQTMRITPPPIANELCGAARPGHFDGVATVVMKLFNIVQPHIAVFGKKDFQQLFIIRELVRQFNLPIDIIAGETQREHTGLALSSRNGYLNEGQKLEAQRLYRTLKLIVDNVQQGNRDYPAIEAQSSQYLTQLGWIVDYISIRSSTTLLPASLDDHNLVVLAAARQGNTRLIDNIEFSV
ncbi:pantoate--beta-alanine ligase [Methylobacillus flagellatus]|uniref:Pantothenate synthetase n=1 Tax=Methylobacillus flagellatus (strain ATCC 51484 / DSM 6875 / VKM B-1610 / KT) TaxID=265072 RepID=PANC_METFK|nr:pantoate--beta-alanine ligase [Methylobacillus flagellatus]Q1H3S1.1 RecName: Full=Pantothenate synthetase; Short=PS; AltName: Full=Pantoate--beta-alanine ligase; AltName: Full=Pantoate-activating enzyme [Methylobacillus flagellatus KT]ABE48866.1 pantothenate synthetase [Methylobacillus flagellatus KT]